MSFDFHAEARRDYEEAGIWYEEQRQRLGIEFADAIEAAISTILKNPERYQVVDPTVHLFRLKRFPYFIYYQFQTERSHVRVLAIMHAKRLPDSWRSRVPK